MSEFNKMGPLPLNPISARLFLAFYDRGGGGGGNPAPSKSNVELEQ